LILTTPRIAATGDVVLTTENWVVTADDQTKSIFPETWEGKTIKITIPKFVLTLCHKRTGATVVFWCNAARGYWHWHDSRAEKNVTRSAVTGEIARLLFARDQKAAGAFVRQHMA